MHRTVIVGLLLAASVTASGIAKNTDAPADEYFGPFKYSAISVRTKINALGRSYRERWADDASIVHDAEMIESSYRVWAQRYPKDVWLAPTGFHLAQLYQNLQSRDARAHARAMYDFVATTYPSSKEGHLARLRLRQGFPALHAETPVSPTPNPYARSSPAPDASGAPAVAQSPAPPPASPSPTFAPSASPSPTATPKR